MQSNVYRYAKIIIKMVNVLLLKVSSETESKLIQKLDALVMCAVVTEVDSKLWGLEFK